MLGFNMVTLSPILIQVLADYPELAPGAPPGSLDTRTKTNHGWDYYLKKNAEGNRHSSSQPFGNDKLLFAVFIGVFTAAFVAKLTRRGLAVGFFVIRSRPLRAILAVVPSIATFYTTIGCHLIHILSKNLTDPDRETWLFPLSRIVICPVADNILLPRLRSWRKGIPLYPCDLTRNFTASGANYSILSGCGGFLSWLVSGFLCHFKLLDSSCEAKFTYYLTCLSKSCQGEKTRNSFVLR